MSQNIILCSQRIRLKAPFSVVNKSSVNTDRFDLAAFAIYCVVPRTESQLFGSYLATCVKSVDLLYRNCESVIHPEVNRCC